MLHTYYNPHNMSDVEKRVHHQQENFAQNKLTENKPTERSKFGKKLYSLRDREYEILAVSSGVAMSGFVVALIEPALGGVVIFGGGYGIRKSSKTLERVNRIIKHRYLRRKTTLT